jgi:hypothetical protein
MLICEWRQLTSRGCLPVVVVKNIESPKVEATS